MIALRLDAADRAAADLGANMAGVVFVISSLHLLYVNNVLLPPALRPPLWRSAALAAMAIFYATFVGLWLGSVLGSFA